MRDAWNRLVERSTKNCTRTKYLLSLIPPLFCTHQSTDWTSEDASTSIRVGRQKICEQQQQKKKKNGWILYRQKIKSRSAFFSHPLISGSTTKALPRHSSSPSCGSFCVCTPGVLVRSEHTAVPCACSNPHMNCSKQAIDRARLHIQYSSLSAWMATYRCIIINRIIIPRRRSLLSSNLFFTCSTKQSGLSRAWKEASSWRATIMVPSIIGHPPGCLTQTRSTVGGAWVCDDRLIA